VLGKKEKDYKKVKDKKNQHTVAKGETLYRIAKKYKVSVEDLKKYNGLEGNEIFVGQVLYVEPFERGY
jgi:LysM repeat protein